MLSGFLKAGALFLGIDLEVLLNDLTPFQGGGGWESSFPCGWRVRGASQTAQCPSVG